MTEFSLPMKLTSLANERVHWSIKSKRAKAQRQAARLVCSNALVGNFSLEPPMTITIVRVGPRKLDSDNLAISAKHVRDGIADALGIDDGNPCLTWEYRQENGPYAVKVTINGDNE